MMLIVVVDFHNRIMCFVLYVKIFTLSSPKNVILVKLSILQQTQSWYDYVMFKPNHKEV